MSYSLYIFLMKINHLFVNMTVEEKIPNLPTGFVEVLQVSYKSIAFPLVCDWILVENFGHINTKSLLFTAPHVFQRRIYTLRGPIRVTRTSGRVDSPQKDSSWAPTDEGYCSTPAQVGQTQFPNPCVLSTLQLTLHCNNAQIAWGSSIEFFLIVRNNHPMFICNNIFQTKQSQITLHR